ncbi:MAG: TonB-dependent receptor [Sphingomonadaceae bacterium]|nr:TonB-dependent receptor [Sphingomonadaceae bacterium]
MRIHVLALALAGISYPTLVNAQAATPADAAQTAQAQPANSAGVQDIVVTAQRREESLQKVPLSVAALSNAQLQQRGITSLAGLLYSGVPGLTVVPFAGAENQLVFNIRGIAAIDPGIGLNDQGVTVYTDGVPIGRTNGGGIELVDLDRVEILRGPQGTLFGRNAEGGAIQFVSKRPSGKFDGFVDGQLGNYNEQRIMGQVDLPEFANISIKVGGLVDRHDGYVENAPTGPNDSLPKGTHQDFDFKNQKAFRVAALWKPAPNFNAYYAFDYSNLHFTNMYQQRFGGRVGVTPAFAAACTGAASDPLFCSFLAANTYTGTQQPEPGRSSVSALPSYVPDNINKNQGHTLILTYDAMDNLQLKSITGYRRVDEVSLNNLDTSTVFVQLIPSSLWTTLPVGTQAAVAGTVANAEIHQHQLSEELQAIGTFGRLQLTTGLFYYHEVLRDIRFNGFNYSYVTDGTSTSLTPESLAEYFPFGTGRQQYNAHADSFAAYGQATYTPDVLDDRLKLIVGLRYTHDKKVFHRVVFGGAPDDLLAPIFKKGRVDPAFTLSFQATPTLNLYAKYSSAYRAGGVGVRNTLALDVYGEEVNKSFEAGFKSELFDHRVRFNADGFYSRVSGYQTSEGNDPINPASTDTVNLNGTVKFYGAETELTVVPVRNLTLTGSYAYLGFKAPKTVSDALGTYALELPNAPHHQLSLSGDYVMPTNSEATILFHGDYSLTSNYVSNPVEFPGVRFPRQSQHTLNARVGAQHIGSGPEKLSVYLFVKNMLNSKDYDYGYNIRETDPNGPTFGGIAVATAPRLFGAEARVDF